MKDREKVIDALEACSFIDHPDCSKCYLDGPGFGFACRDQLMRDALALLKEYVEMEKNYSQVLMETTGNLLSKTNYTVPVIMDCIQNHYCDRCDVKEERDALLKAQEPRVMTYDELVTFDGAFLLESCDILSELDWVFFFDTDSKSDAIWVEGFDGERCVVYREDYGKYARCWTARATNEQREATPWRT